MSPITVVALLVFIVAIWGIQHVWRREWRRKQAEYRELDNYRGPELDTQHHDSYDSDGRPL